MDSASKSLAGNRSVSERFSQSRMDRLFLSMSVLLGTGVQNSTEYLLGVQNSIEYP